ncbi:MAG: transketolase family protein [Acetivibrionales bacterium]|jgi:transketolase
MLDKKAMKDTYCETLMELMQENPQLVVLEADLMSASGTKPIMGKYPDRLINVGVAEANMVGVAAGLSTFGKVPVCDTFAAFMSRRTYDQICISVCYAGLNVKFVGTDPGIAAERNGGTHTAFEDVALMRTLPTMKVIEPCDNLQLKKAVKVMVNTDGPVYMRLYRRNPHIVYSDTDYEFVLGKADTLQEGKDLTIIASGLMVWNSLVAAETLRGKGINARVVNMHTIKPIDEEAILKAARETGAIVTAENNNYLNGLGSAVAEVLCENDASVPFKRIGIKDHFSEIGTQEYLFKKFHIAPEDIVEASLDVLKKKDLYK